MQTLTHFCPHVEIYSIDEAFLALTGFSERDWLDYGQQIRHTVKQWTGIPLSIGIAPIQTLAKIANHMAKADASTGGVVDLTSEANLDAVLSTVAVGAVWGMDYGQQMRRTVKQGTGIPLSIGIAPTKTLAKIANHMAKADASTGGVVDLTHAPSLDAVLSAVAVEAVWGIGRHG